VDVVRRVREREDPEYAEIFSILNKLAVSNITSLSDVAAGLMKKRDEQFRLRISALIFDKAITNHMFSEVMSKCVEYLVSVFPEMKEDLTSQIEMFPVLYNMNDTVLFPASSDPDFDTNVIKWMKQKEKRRGYAKFVAYLYLNHLIQLTAIAESVQYICADLRELLETPKNTRTDENIHQIANSLFEIVKLVPDIARSPQLQETTTLALASSVLDKRSKFKFQDIVDIMRSSSKKTSMLK
jgi:hypothetical protein